MKIYQVLKILSNPNKAKIIAHFWDCTCEQGECVNGIGELLKINQSNLSKHFGNLQKAGILKVQHINKHRYYGINPDFKNKWAKIVDPIIENEILKPFICQKCQSCTSN